LHTNESLGGSRGDYFPHYLAGEGKITAIKRVRQTHPNYLGLAEAKALVDTWGEAPATTVLRLIESAKWDNPPTQAVVGGVTQTINNPGAYFDGSLKAAADYSWQGTYRTTQSSNSNMVSNPADQNAALLEELSQTARRFRDAYADLERRFEEYKEQMVRSEAAWQRKYEQVCAERDSLAADLAEAIQ
jgi:hypothetical protein